MRALGRIRVVALAAASLAVAGCAGAPGPVGGTGGRVSGSAANPADHTIPPEYLPPPGQCRIWQPDRPLEEQAEENPAGRCSQLRESIPAGGWLVYRPPDASGIVRVWRYGEGGEVVSQRIHDAETGVLLRHVRPAGS